MYDHDPSKNPSVSATSARRRTTSRQPKASAKEARELLSAALTKLYEATAESRAVQERLREALAENRELRAAIAEKAGR